MPQTFIARYAARGGKPRYWTVDPEGLDVQYKERTKRVGQSILGPIVQKDGADKSVVNIRSRSDCTLNSWGSMHGLSWLTIRLLDRHKSLRVAREQDLAALAELDVRIDAKHAELKALRGERHTMVQGAWERAGKIDIEVLEAKANGPS